MFRSILRQVAPALILLAFGSSTGFAGDDPKVDSELSFIADMETIYVNFVQDQPTVDWLKKVFAALDEQFKNESKKRTIVLQATLHPDRAAEVTISGRPALTEAEAKAILKAADLTRSPKTRVVDGTFRIITNVNGGTPDDSGPLVPPLASPAQIILAKFRPLSVPGKRAFMQNWARTEAIPLLAEFAVKREGRQSEAIRVFGKTIQALPREGPYDVAALTEKNPDFWKAILASPTSDPLVPMTLGALYVANGEIARAKRVVNAFTPFDEKKFGSSYVLLDFRRMDIELTKEVSDRIKQGIALNDQGRYDAATKIYNDVLKDDPKSAWAMFERFQTKQIKGLTAKGDREKLAVEWKDVRKAILDVDPLYESMAIATGAAEAYDLLLRKEIEGIYKDPETLVKSSVRYAEIARELGENGFAAMLFLTVYKNVKPEAYGHRKLLEDALYCFEALGVKDLKAKVKGDHTTEFKRIDEERAKQKRENTAYKSFVDPDSGDAEKKKPDR